MKSPAFLQKNARPLFNASWFLLGLIQAIFTELQDDEAYYWVYAQYLDWGYFDHPPMTALLIKGGTLLFGKELGIRILPLVLNTATLWITEKLIAGRNNLLFYAICLSVAVIQITGFWAVPDVPLLFFTALFFWCYQNFLKSPYLKNAALLGVACALLLYTKYHGVLIIFFTLLSNLKLLRNKYVYVAGILALLLFLPHLWWQYGHNWMSFRYHLFESNVNRYKLSYTTEYVLGQLAIAGPITGVILLWATFTYKPQSALEKGLKYTGVGMFLFFFLSTFKGKVEANWTAPAIIPMLVLTHQFLVQKAGWRKWLYRLLPVTIVLVLFARLIMMVDLLPVKAIVQRFHAWKGWPKDVAAKTGGLPLVFNNSYQRASKIWFYTGQKSYSLNSYKERRSNYNFWPVEDSLLGKPVYNLDIYNLQNFKDSLPARLWQVGFNYDSSFQSFAKITFRPAQQKFTARAGEILPLSLSVSLSPYYQQYLQQHPQADYPIIIGVFQKRDWIKDIPTSITLQQLTKQQLFQIPIQPQLPKGTYYLRMAIGSSTGLFTHNSDKIDIEIE